MLIEGEGKGSAVGVSRKKLRLTVLARSRFEAWIKVTLYISIQTLRTQRMVSLLESTFAKDGQLTSNRHCLSFPEYSVFSHDSELSLMIDCNSVKLFDCGIVSNCRCVYTLARFAKEVSDPHACVYEHIRKKKRYL